MPLIRHLLLALLSVTAAHAEDLQLTLPPTLYATPGVEMNIYHDNIVLTQTPENYRCGFESRHRYHLLIFRDLHGKKVGKQGTF